MSPNDANGAPVAPHDMDTGSPEPAPGTASLGMYDLLALAATAVAVVLASSVAVVMFLA